MVGKFTQNQGIHEFNKETRNIDAPTDVLSFPNIEYDIPGNFEMAEEQEADCFEPDSGELILGDIIISVEKVISQAEEYGHSKLRERTYLIVHGLMHLFGYDHEDEADKKQMREKEKQALKILGIEQ